MKKVTIPWHNCFTGELKLQIKVLGEDFSFSPPVVKFELIDVVDSEKIIYINS